MLRRRNISLWLVSLLICNLSFGGAQSLWLCLHEQMMAHIVRKDVALQECNPFVAAGTEQEVTAVEGLAVSTPEDCTDIKLGDDSTPRNIDQQLAAPSPVFIILFSILLEQVEPLGRSLPTSVNGRAPPAQLHASLSVADSVVFRL